MKNCIKCNETKELSEFNFRDKSKGTYRNECKTCIKLYHKIYNIENSEKIGIQKKLYRKENISTIKEKSKRHYDINRDRIKSKSIDRYNSLKDDESFMERNREMNRKCWIKYREDNRDRINEKIRERKKSDPLYKLQFSIRSSISNSIIRMGYSKNDKTRNILGCSFECFMKHIEEQFTEGMSWDNHGEWHLDHKIPVSWAKTESEIYELNKYENFQPLWGTENMSKGNRYSH